MIKAQGFAFFAVFLLIASLGLDLTPRFHQGDSNAYIWTGSYGYMPDNMSWSYGLFINKLLALTRDIVAIPFLQIVSLWLCSLLVVETLGQRFRLGDFGRGVCLLALFANPLAFYWSRAIMTDTWAVCGFNLIVYILLTRQPVFLTSAVVFIIGLVLASLRIVYLAPLILSLLTTLVLLAGASLIGNRAWQWAEIVRAGSYATCLLAANIVYGFTDATIHHGQSIFGNQWAARLLVSAWSPVLDQKAIDSIGLLPEERNRLELLSYERRVHQAFVPDGLANIILEHVQDKTRADLEYRRLMKRAVLDHPLAFVTLVARSWSDYLNPFLVSFYHRSLYWSGAVGFRQPIIITDEVIKKLEKLGLWQKFDPALPSVPSFGLWYYSVGAFWPLLLAWYATFAAPAIAITLAWRGREWDVATIHLFGFAYIAAIAFASLDMQTRYLLPLGSVLVTGAAWLYSNTGWYYSLGPSRALTNFEQ